jgi:hypothetical protein
LEEYFIDIEEVFQGFLLVFNGLDVIKLPDIIFQFLFNGGIPLLFLRSLWNTLLLTILDLPLLGQWLQTIPTRPFKLIPLSLL